MALVLTEEQSMLRDSARGLISDKAPVSHLRAAARRQGRDRLLPRALEEFCRDGLCRPVGAGRIRRQRARLCRGRNRDGGDRPHPDAVAVPVDRGARCVCAVARRQRGAEGRASAEDFLGRIDRGARRRRRRQASPAADRAESRALRQRLQALRREGACRRRPCRRSPDRRRAQRGRGRREQRADACSWSIPRPRALRPSAPSWSIPTTPRASNSTMSRSMPIMCSARSTRAMHCSKACSISAAARLPPKWWG